MERPTPHWAPVALVSRAMAGETSAAEALVATIWARCFTCAAAAIGDRNMAQDAALEACAIIHQKIRSLKHIEAFDSWVYRIVIREAGRVRRRHASIQPPHARGLSADSTTAIDVWRALSDLPPVLRDATVLFYFEDLQSDEIATILRIPHATVRTRLARARERLRGLLHNYSENFTRTNLEEVKHAR